MTSAIQDWKTQVSAHDTQAATLPDTPSWASGDMWRPLMSNFKMDPRRTDDDTLNRLMQRVDPESTVLDVGGGAGRFALPLALKCKHVTVVEPADSMVEALGASREEAGITNVSVVQELWDVAKVDPVDVVLAAHAVYGVVDAEQFLRKLEATAKEQVIILAYTEQPQSQLAPFWKSVYGDERINLPGLREIINVLWEMDIYPDLDMFPPASQRSWGSRESALDQLRRQLHVSPDSEEDERLKKAVDDLLIETPDGLALRDTKPRVQGIISWSPE